MRKVVLGSKQTTPYPSAKFLQIPRDGSYQDTAFNVMDLKLHPWNDHYTYTTSNMVTSQNLLMPVCTEGANKSVWVLNETGALEKVNDTIMASPTNTVQVTFIATKNDGSKLYWITQCLCPKGRGNVVHDKEVRELVSKENIPDSTVEVYAVKPVCMFNVNDLQTGIERQVRHTNRLFKTAPEWDKIIALFDKTFIGNAGYVAREKQPLEDTIIEKITSQEMLQWMEHNGLEVYLDKIYSEKTEEKGYSTDNGMSIETTSAIAVTSYSVQDCPCVVSSNILLMDDDDMPEEPTGTSESFYFSFNEEVYYKTWKRTLAIYTKHHREFPFIRTSTDFGQYSQFTELGRPESDTIRWERPVSPTGYAHKDTVSKVILFETPIDVSSSVGHDSLITGRTTKLFAYCPEKDVFIGQRNFIVYPWDVQWIEEPYVYVKPEEPEPTPEVPFYALCAYNVEPLSWNGTKEALYDGRVIKVDAVDGNVWHICQVIVLRDHDTTPYNEQSENYVTHDVDMTIQKQKNLWVMTEFYNTPKHIIPLTAHKPENVPTSDSLEVSSVIGRCENHDIYVAMHDIYWRIISDVVFV